MDRYESELSPLNEYGEGTISADVIYNVAFEAERAAQEISFEVLARALDELLVFAQIAKQHCPDLTFQIS